MANLINDNHPLMQILVITKARTLPEVISFFMTIKRREAIQFNPDWIILHVGHNDIIEHCYFNKHSQYTGNIADLQVQFARNLQTIVPQSTISCSSIFPRTSTPRSNLSGHDTAAYNRIAKRYGLRLRQLSTIHHLHCSLNMAMWTQVYRARENTAMFSGDGLHLTPAAKRRIGDDWIRTFNQP
jgi:lysophospholipase L1-like esterase